MNWLVIAICVLLALDVVTTLVVLNGGGREMNPVLRWLMELIGVELALAVTHIGIGALVLIYHPERPSWPLSTFAALLLGVVINNLAALNKQSR